MLLRRHFDEVYEVRGVTRGRKGSRSAEHLVHRAAINASRGRLTIFLGHVPDEGALNEQLLRLGLVDHVDSLVPSATFEVEAVDEDAVFWFLGDIRGLDFIVHFIVERQFVDGNHVFPCIVLHGSREECLGEEETGDPVGGWHAILDPFGEESEALVQVRDPGGEWLQGKRSDLGESSRYLVIEQTNCKSIEIVTHYHLSFKSSLDIFEHSGHYNKQFIVPDHLLDKYGVH